MMMMTTTTTHKGVLGVKYGQGEDGDGDGDGNGNWDRDRDWYEGDDENVGGGRQQLRRHVRC